MTASSLELQGVTSSADLLRLLSDSMPSLVAYFRDEDFRCLFANKAYAQHFGRGDREVIGMTVREIVGEAAFAVILPYIERAKATREAVSYERPQTDADGHERTLEVRLVPHLNSAGESDGAFVLINDITRRQETQRALRESEERLRKFADATSEGIVFLDNGIIIDSNEAAARLMSLTPAEMVGRDSVEFIAPEDRETVIANIRSGYERPYEVCLLRPDGTRVAVELVGKNLVYDGIVHRMTVVRDISDRKQAEARIQFLAHHDTLTHLPNRALLLERLQMILAAARRQNTLVGVMFIDLDNFKTINDSLGHYAGDELLKRVASRLQACLRDADMVGRLGGDEFVVVVTDLKAAEDIAPIAEKIAEAITEPFSLEGQVLSVSGSIGISVFPKDGDKPDTLIRNADAAMYLAKDRGRSNFQFFMPSLNKSAFQALALESGIRKAIRQLEFELHYQPQIDARTGAVNSVEALIRWRHPDLGLLGPDQFISVAEHRGLIMPIGRWVINEAIRQARVWADLGFKIRVAVNISAVQFKQKDLVEDIASRLHEHGMPGNMLELELTESLFMEDVHAMSKTLGRLKGLGVMLAVDDFGTGYSSLSYLKRYPIDKIKIDRSFVRDLPTDPDNVAITMAILSLAKSLGPKVVAEGVEKTTQLDFLKKQRCDYIQGYLVSRPLGADAMLAWLKRRDA